LLLSFSPPKTPISILHMTSLVFAAILPNALRIKEVA